MMLLGITGGIGAGKSVVCRVFSALGFPVFDTDLAAWNVMLHCDDVRHRLASVVGSACLQSREAMRQALSEYVFSSRDGRERINGIVHPAVRQAFLSWAGRCSAPLAVMECAILFEAGFDAVVQQTLMVCADQSVRLERVMQRSGLTREQALQRMAAQMPETDKCLRANYIIENNPQSLVVPQVLQLLRQLQLPAPPPCGGNHGF